MRSLHLLCSNDRFSSKSYRIQPIKLTDYYPRGAGGTGAGAAGLHLPKLKHIRLKPPPLVPPTIMLSSSDSNS